MQPTIYTEDHIALQDSLKKFCESEINPHIEEWEKAEIFPAKELFRKMGKLGFLGVNKPVEYGGQGLDYSYAAAFAEGGYTVFLDGVVGPWFLSTLASEWNTVADVEYVILQTTLTEALARVLRRDGVNTSPRVQHARRFY